MSKSTILKSAFFLTFSSVITRLIGFVYRIYMSNQLGSVGMGRYQLIMPVYMLGWSLICSGFTTTISKLVSEYSAKKNQATAKKVLYLSLFYSLCVGFIFSGILFLFSDYIANSIFNQPSIAQSFRILSFAFPFMSVGSCVRSYFLGLQQPVIPSISQIVEQVSRIACISICILYFGKLTVEIAILGSVLSEVVATIFLLFFYTRIKAPIINKQNIVSYTILSPIVLFMALPLTANRVTTSLLNTYENILITEKLQEYGLTQTQAIGEFGKVSGLAMPLIAFPTTIIISIAIALVPAISELIAQKNTKKTSSLINTTLTFVSIISFYFASIFVLFSKQLGLLIYNQDISFLLCCFGALSPFMYTNIIFHGILNGLGKQLYIFYNNIVSAIIALAFIYYLVPRIGITGFIIAYALSILYSCIAGLIKVCKYTLYHFDTMQLFLKPLLSASATALTINLIYRNTNGGLIILGLFCMITFTLYIATCILVGCIKISDIKKALSFIKLPTFNKNSYLN